MTKKTFEQVVIDAATTLPIPEAVAALTVGIRILKNRKRAEAPPNGATPLGKKARKAQEKPAEAPAVTDDKPLGF
jgi:hypothetical protein